MLISVFFYFSLSKLLLSNGINNKFKIFGIIANLFLCIYIVALGIRDSSFYEITRRLGIDRLSETAKKFGLGGRVLDIFNEEKAGVVPSTKWKLKNIGKNWYLLLQIFNRRTSGILNK